IKLGDWYILQTVFAEMVELIKSDLAEFHEAFPMREGKNKAELKQTLKSYGLHVSELVIDQVVADGTVIKSGQYIASSQFKPSFPKQWAKRM
ncbi:DNA/RNA-binding winged helix domain-containing protein, partial [Pseudomonas sp. 2822-17]|uniref:DNA/RNA-binding winged helix domain-containing protein n=1 Tax=Pseudomonas sp. 2822-17 TaxID=1712678 RepID=UPI001C46C985